MARSALSPAAALSLRRRVGAVLAFRVLSRASAVWPVLVPFYRGHGALSDAEVFWLAAVFALARLAGERPALWLADRAGRRSTLVLSSMAAAGGAGVVLMGAELASFLAGEALLGIAWAARTAAVPDLLSATLASAGQGDDAWELERRVSALETGCGVGAMLLAGLLLVWSPLGPYLWLLTTASGALVCALLLDEPARRPSAGRGGLGAALGELRSAPALAWPLLAGAIGGALSLVVRLSQQVLLESLGWAPPWLGVAAAAAALFGLAVLEMARGRLRLGPVAWLSSALAPVFAMAALPLLLVTPTLLLRGASDAARRRSLGELTARLGGPQGRPALVSLSGDLGRLGAIVGAASLALLAPALGIRASLAVIGASAVVLTGLIVWGCSRLGPLESADVFDLPQRRPDAGPPRRRD